jgi:hypothetical protein
MHACLEAVNEHLYVVASRNIPASAGVAKLIQVVNVSVRQVWLAWVT